MRIIPGRRAERSVPESGLAYLELFDGWLSELAREAGSLPRQQVIDKVLDLRSAIVMIHQLESAYEGSNPSTLTQGGTPNATRMEPEASAPV